MAEEEEREKENCLTEPEEEVWSCQKHDPSAFSHCKDQCKVRLAGPQGALTLETLASVVA